jgi:hypothetical protein
MENINLPPEILCLIAERVETISTIRNLIRSNPIWINIIPYCIRKISRDVSEPNEIISFKTIRHFRNLEEVKIPIRIDNLGELVNLAKLPKLGYYDIRVGPSPFPDIEPGNELLVLFNTFLLIWIRSNKKIRLRALNISREPTVSLMSRLLGFNRVSPCRLDNGVLFFERDYMRLPIFDKILNNLNYLGVINIAVGSYPDLGDKSYYLLGMLYLLTIVDYYNDLIRLLDIPSIMRVSIDPKDLEILYNRDVILEVSERLQFGTINPKPVEIIIPIEPEFIFRVDRAFPNLRSIGILDISVPVFPDTLFNILEEYPNLTIYLITKKRRSVYDEIINRSDRIRILKI